MSRAAPFPNLVIRASAGTGKTYQLALRFINILASGGAPEEILATTFTRKAAGEILDRVLDWLAAAAGDDRERQKLADAIGLAALTQQTCRDLLRTTVSRLHALRVGTLDSFFLRIATSFGHELGLPPGWTICDEQTDALLREEAIEQVLAGRVADLLTLVHALTKGVATRSVARLVTDTVRDLLELYRETTPEVWRQLNPGKPLAAEKLDELLASIESLAIDNPRMTKARAEDLTRFRAAAWDAFLDKGLAGKVLSGECVYYSKPLPADLVQLYERLLQHVKAIVVGQVARQTEATHDLLERFAERYLLLQLSERSLRFSDITFHLASAASLLAPERLAFRLDGGIRHVLLDEFQDTSPVQWRILRPLAQVVTRQSRGSFFCVGDVKQAIYGWRGGVAAIFQALDAELPKLQSSSLATSYRSSQPVIDAVNQVFQNLTRHPHLDKLADPVQRFQQEFPPHSTARTELAGYVALGTAPAADGGDQSQKDITLHYAAQRIQSLVQAAPAASVGVLVRTNDAVARMIYELRQLDIPASEEGGNPLIDSPAVELILSLLRLADHPADTVARFHLATSPLAAALEFKDHQSDAAAARTSQALRRQLLDEGYGQTIFAWAGRLAASCQARDLTRLQQLVELAYEYQPQSTLRTRDFLRLVQQRRIADPQSAAVRVMTVHQAKGLEFDIVVLPELDVKLKGQPDRVAAGRPSPSEPVNAVCRHADENVRQFFPPQLQQLFQDDMCLEVSESLCLLYVAMTRAVHALHMIVPPSTASEKHLPKTFAGLLRATLATTAPAAAATTLYEHGDARWPSARPPHQPSKSPAAAPTATANDHSVIRLAPALSQRQRGLDRTSPSALEGGHKLPAAALLKPRSSAGMAVGTLVHAWFAEIEWLGNQPPDPARLKAVANRLRAQLGKDMPPIDPLLTRFYQQIAAAPIAALLKPAYYADPAALGLTSLARSSQAPTQLTALREQPFAIRRAGEILTGSIDRLVIFRENGKPVAADIIDFKTDDIPAGDSPALKAKIDFYTPQIEAYRQAVSQLLALPKEKIAARLAFLALGRVEALAATASK